MKVTCPKCKRRVEVKGRNCKYCKTDLSQEIEEKEKLIMREGAIAVLNEKIKQEAK